MVNLLIMKIKILALTAAILYISCGTVDLAKKYPNMVADIDPYQIGSVSASFDRFMFPHIRENNIDVFFYPRENMVVLDFRYELLHYRQFWDEPGRQRFTEALSRYKEDLANQNMLTRYNRTRDIYGRFKGRTEWEFFKYTATYFSLPVMELGYRFREDVPYFAILQNSARDESGINNKSRQESVEISIYFSGAQAEALASLFDREFLLKSLMEPSDELGIESEELVVENEELGVVNEEFGIGSEELGNEELGVRSEELGNEELGIRSEEFGIENEELEIEREEFGVEEN